MAPLRWGAALLLAGALAGCQGTSLGDQLSQSFSDPLPATPASPPAPAPASPARPAAPAPAAKTEAVRCGGAQQEPGRASGLAWGPPEHPRSWRRERAPRVSQETQVLGQEATLESPEAGPRNSGTTDHPGMCPGIQPRHPPTAAQPPSAEAPSAVSRLDDPHSASPQTTGLGGGRSFLGRWLLGSGFLGGRLLRCCGFGRGLAAFALA